MTSSCIIRTESAESYGASGGGGLLGGGGMSGGDGGDYPAAGNGNNRPINPVSNQPAARGFTAFAGEGQRLGQL